MPRLLILCEFPTLLGGERSMLATLPAVAAAGFDIQVAAPPDGPLASAVGEIGIPLAPWSTRDPQGEKLPLAESRANLERLIRAAQPDLVHVNSLSTARISGPVTAHVGMPSIGHLRDILKLPRQAIDDINCHPRLLAVSQATRAFHVAQGIDDDRCHALHNGVNLERFQPRAPTGYLHRELGVPAAARFVITVGQLGLRKATDVALAAATRVAAELPEVHWLVVGERTSAKEESREFEASLHATASKPPLAGRVHFLGNRDDVPQLHNECSLLVHAARQEPLARVLLEACASGLPAIATNVGGTGEIYPTDADGAILVPPDDAVALAEAELALLRDESRRSAMVAAARRRAEAAFDIRLAAARLLEHYHSMLR